MSPPPHRSVPLQLDESTLAKLHELDPGGRSGIVKRILRTYEQSLDKLMAQFARARAAGDGPGLRHVAHTLRSSSASIGALELAAACQAVERHLRDQDAEALDPKLDALADEGERAAQAVRAILGSPDRQASPP